MKALKDSKVPADGSGARSSAVGGDGCGQGAFKNSHRAGKIQIKCRLIKGRAAQNERCARQVCRNNSMGVGQIDVFKCQRSRDRRDWADLGVRLACVLPPANATVCGPVVMTGTSLVPVIVIVNGTVVPRIVRCEIVVDLRHIGQRQRFAGGEEIESVVREAVGEGRRTVIIVAGAGDRNQLNSIAAMSASCCAFSVAVTSPCAAFW